jgi:hypothetical protein
MNYTPHGFWDRVKMVVYKLGFRPKFRTIFFSPSLDIIYHEKDWRKKGVDWQSAFETSPAEKVALTRIRVEAGEPRCGYTWFRDLTGNWVQCQMSELDHPTNRHIHDEAFVVLGHEEEVRAYWAVMRRHYGI